MRTTDNRHFGLKPRRPQCGHFTVKISWTSWNVNQIFFELMEVIVGTTFLMITIVCCKRILPGQQWKRLLRAADSVKLYRRVQYFQYSLKLPLKLEEICLVVYLHLCFS